MSRRPDTRAPQASSRREFVPVLQVLAGSGAYLGLGFLAHLVAANGLSASDFAALSLAMALMAVVQEVGGSGVDEAVVRHAAPLVAREPDAADRLLAGALMGKMLVVGALALGLWTAAPALQRWMGSSPSAVGAYRWAAVGSVCAAAFGWALAVLQTRRAFGAYAVMRPLPTIAKAAGMVGVWLLGGLTLSWAMAMSTLTFLPALVLLPWFTRARGMVRPERAALDVWPTLLRFAGWLVAAKVGFALYARVDLFLLERFADAPAVAAYAVAGSLLFMVDLTTFSIIISLLPEASAIASRDDLQRYAARARRHCLALGALFLPVLLAIGPLVSVLYQGRYPEAAAAFRILFVGAAATLFVHPLYLVLYAQNKPHLLAVVNLVQLVTCATLGWHLVPTAGTTGAAWSSATARLLGCALILLLVRREAKTLPAAAAVGAVA